jgi:protein TonB
MPVYASTPGFAAHRRHPSALLLIVGGHAVLIAAVMTARMDLPVRVFDPPIVVDPIPIPPEPTPPEPVQQDPRTDPRPQNPVLPRPEQIVPVPPLDGPIVDTTPVPMPNPGPVIGNNLDLGTDTPTIDPPVMVGPRFVTPQHLIEPPYPADKQRLEEEAVLRLKLSIDQRGRVVAVEPVGRTDRSFLEAARRHLIANWRYKPATEDGKPIASSTVITLTFRIA